MAKEINTKTSKSANNYLEKGIKSALAIGLTYLALQIGTYIGVAQSLEKYSPSQIEKEIARRGKVSIVGRIRDDLAIPGRGLAYLIFDKEDKN